jgi:TM2 domain-containing membrane protein YozV
MVKEASEKQSFTGVVSFILGLLSLVFSIQLPLGSAAGLFLAVLGLIFGLVQLYKGRNSWAVWGIILSIIGAITNILIFLWLAKLASLVVAKMQELQSSGLLSSQIPQIPAVQ